MIRVLKGRFKKKEKKLMEFSIKGPYPPTHPPTPLYGQRFFGLLDQLSMYFEKIPFFAKMLSRAFRAKN